MPPLILSPSFNSTGSVSAPPNLTISGRMSAASGVFSDNVGIGTSSPSIYGSLTLTGDIFVNAVGSGGHARIFANTNQSVFSSNNYYNGTNDLSALSGYSPQLDLRIDDGSIRFKTSTTVAANTVLSLSERMRITSSGNVGIATSSPTALLHINGTSATTPFMAVGSATKNLSYAIENSTENTLKIFSTTGKSKLSFISPNGQSNTIAFSGYDSGTSTSTVHTTITESDAGMSINFTKDIGASGTYVGSQLPPFAIKSGSTNLIYTGQKDINADHTYGGYYTGLDAIILGTTAKPVYADTLPAYGRVS